MSVAVVDQIFGNPNVVNFAANTNVQQQLQNGYSLDHLQMRLTGNLTLASYSTPPAKYVEALENLLGVYSLTATGSGAGATTDQVTSVDGPFLRYKQRMFEGTDAIRNDIGTSNGTYAFETNLTKYFMDPRSDKKYLTRMFTNLLSSLTAAYQWRDATAMVYGGSGGSATLSGVQLTVQARMQIGMAAPNPSPYVRETQRTFTVNQSQNAFRCDKVPVGQVLRRQYFKGMLGAVPYADPSDSVFGATGQPEGPHIQFKVNNNVTMLNKVYQQMRNDNKTMFEQESMPTGYAVYEPSRKGKLVNSIPLAGAQNADNFVDVNYTSGSINTIQITDEQIVAVSPAQYAA